MKKELLAPAGDFECLKSAINSGADAVYFGFNQFNARANVENFNADNLRDAVKYAHLHGVKMYMALNILIDDEEIDDVINTVNFARQCRVDAFIVQDIGLATLLKECFPGIELHASTQMGVSTLEGARFLKKHGFSRVVLARETSISEVRRIKENLDIEIEYFVQGALCVGYSGNCYFSSLVENASGNRGKCKQLCRLPYEMKYDQKKKSGYLLSAKDLCMLPLLKELSQAGVDSFKIEGRARRAAYVAGAVEVYREALDNNYHYSDNQIIKLKHLFNRGHFACGYLKQENMIYPQICSHIGVEIGRVETFKKGNRFNEVIVGSSHDITRGDLLQFESSSGMRQSVSVYDVKKLKSNQFYLTTTNIVEKGAKVSLLVNSRLEEDILKKKAKIAVGVEFKAKAGQKAVLRLSAQDVAVIVESEETCEKSKSQPLTKEECNSQLAKMGDEFVLASLDFDCDEVFIRKAQLNQLRRDGLRQLQKEIVVKREQHLSTNFNSLKQGDKQKEKANNKKILIFNQFSKLMDNIACDDYIVYSPSDYNKEELEKINSLAKNIVYLDTPPFAQEADLKFLLEICASCDKIGVVANNYYALSLTSPEKTIIGSELNVVNSATVNFYKELGYNKIILNKEGFYTLQMKDKTGLFVNSNLQERLIYFKHCPIKEQIGGDCSDCRYKEGITYSLAGKKYRLERKKIKSCLFMLKMAQPFIRENIGFGKVIEK